MGVTDRLSSALEERADTARPAPDALDRIRGRAQRRRQAARLRVAGGVAVVAALAVATPVLLRPAATSQLVPPAATPTTAPTAPTAASPTPDLSPMPTRPAPAPARPDEFAVITAGRELALVSTRTGDIVRAITTFATMPTSVDLAPDGRTALVTVPPAVQSYDPPASEDECPYVVEVDVVSGAQRRLTSGWSPRYSPDGRSVAVTDCPGDAVRILRSGAPAETFPGAGPDQFGGDVAWSGDGKHLYVQEVGDDSNWLVRLDPAKHRSLADAERVVVTYFTTMNVPVPWRDTLLHTSSDEIEEDWSRGVHAGRSYSDGYLRDADTLFTVPHPVDAVAVGPGDEILVEAGKALWRWAGSGEAVRIGPAYPVFGW